MPSDQVPSKIHRVGRVSSKSEDWLIWMTSSATPRNYHSAAWACNHDQFGACLQNGVGSSTLVTAQNSTGCALRALTIQVDGHFDRC
jgi:hypothetical protein